MVKFSAKLCNNVLKKGNFLNFEKSISSKFLKGFCKFEVIRRKLNNVDTYDYVSARIPRHSVS